MRKWVVHEVLADAAYQYGSIPVISGARRLTYAAVYERSVRLANKMEQLGIGPGTVVGVMDVNSHRYLELKYALSMTGAVIHTINFRLPAADMAFTIHHAHDEWLFVWSGFGEVGAQMASLVSQVVWLEGQPDAPGRSYEELIAGGRPELPAQAERVREDDTYSLFYTTGTTGRPKGLRYSHREMLAASFQIAHDLGLHDTGAGLRADDVLMPLIPFFHIHGWGVPFIAPYLGSALVLPEKAGPGEQVQLIRENRVTWSNMVPTQLFMLLQESGKDRGAVRGLKVLTGGSPLSRGLAEKAAELGVQFSLIYGGSDQLGSAISTAAGLAGEERLERLSSRMSPFPMVRVEIRDGAGAPAPSDGATLGEVWVQSPWIPQGYVDNLDETRYAFQSGWFRTGDLAVRNPDGSFQVMDRIKDAIKSGGEWIAGSVIESVISEVPGVEAVAVIGQPDAQWGERPVAVVQAAQDLTAGTIQEYLRQAVSQGRIAKFWVPDRIHFISAMPMTSAGKLHKAALRRPGALSSS